MATLYPAKACPICGTIHRRLLALCDVHEQRVRRHGSPHAFAITNADLKPYKPIAEGLLRKYENDKAVKAIHALMESILTGFGADCDHATPGRIARPRLDVLLAAGATARTSLTELLAVALYWQMGDKHPDAPEMELALGRRLLLHKRYKGSNIHTLTRKALGGIGYRIRCDLLPTLFQMSQHYLRSIKAHDEQRLAAREFSPTF